MKIGVMGAGAVGCYIGGGLAASGMVDGEVVLVARDRVKREVDDNGLHLGDLDGTTTTVPRARFVFDTDPGRLADRDVVLCCVKSGATPEAAERLATVLRRDALVVSFQNGLRNADELRERLGGRTVLAGIVNFNILAKGGGRFRRATSGALFIQRSYSSASSRERSDDPRANELAVALRKARFDVELPADIRGVQWSKLLLNLNNAVSALSDRPTKEIVLSPGYRRVLSAVIGESLVVLRAANIRPGKIGPLPVAIVPHALRLPTPLVRLVARAQLAIDPEARSSMWEDLTSGRPTEVDWLNGEIVRLAESCGAPAPLNRRIVDLVHEAERAGAGSPKLSAEELWGKLVQA
jgi:2-dehydropantoate 2-reductase